MEDDAIERISNKIKTNCNNFQILCNKGKETLTLINSLVTDNDDLNLKEIDRIKFYIEELKHSFIKACIQEHKDLHYHYTYRNELLKESKLI